MDKRELLARLTQARAELLAAIEGLSEADVTVLPVAGAWTIRDVLAHIGGWAAWDLAEIRGIQAGRPPDLTAIQDVDTFNAGLVAARSTWSLDQIRAEMAETQAAMLSLLADLSDEDLFRGASFRGPYWDNLAGWLQVAWEHEEEHVAQIRAWRAAHSGSASDSGNHTRREYQP